ncbi:MAG: hypothetical protein WAU36_03325 [Cyclobacteriaceae bacterium]
MEVNIPNYFKIPRASINFDSDISVKSFSLLSDNEYALNLFKVTCSCPDFSKSMRSRYAYEDIRRQCKHLLYHYRENIGLNDVSDLLKCAFSHGYPLRHYLEEIVLDEFEYKVLVNHDGSDGWWIIFVQDQKGAIKAYGYSSLGNQFPFEKPIGIVTALKKKLREIRKQLVKTESRSLKSIKNRKEADDDGYGCIIILGILIFLIVLYFCG